MIHNNYQDRQRIRNELIYKACMPYRDFTPVLLMYWTEETLYQFLIPCTSEQLKKLYPLNGVDENGTACWDEHRETFNFLKNMISSDYEEGERDYAPQGEWREMYFIDTHDEDGRPLPSVTLPPATVLIITGVVL